MPSVVRIHLPPRSRPRSKATTRTSIEPGRPRPPRQRPEANEKHAGVAQLVELQPSKLVVEGSSPFARSNESPRPSQRKATTTFHISVALVAQWQCTSLVRKGSRVQFSPRARQQQGDSSCRKKSSSATSRTSTSERS